MKNIILVSILFLLITTPNYFAKENCEIKQTGDAVISFEGYKTIFKAGISFEFSKVEYKAKPNNASNMEEFLSAYDVLIDTNSIRTSKDIIAKNLVEFFFKKLDDDKINAKISTVMPIDRKKGKGKLSLDLTMNSVNKSIEMEYFVKKITVLASGVININDFNASVALSYLNKMCYDVHLGKTWHDVGINFSIPIKKVCKK